MKSNYLNKIGVAVITGAVAFGSLAAPASAQEKVQRTAEEKAQRKAERQQKRATQKAAQEKQQPTRTAPARQTRVVEQPRVVQQPRVELPEAAPQRRTTVQPRQERVQVQPQVRQPVVIDQRNTRVLPERRTARLPEQRQKQLVVQQQQRLERYRNRLNQQRIADMQARIARLRDQRRLAQWRYQQEYWERIRQQQLQLQQARYYNYYQDPFFYTAPSYRYQFNNRWYDVNDYGVNLLQQAVNYGYSEGFRAGQADRQDRWGFNFRDSYAYTDANYGYGGFYLDQDVYNHYFRQGFERGYEDGYYSRNRYGYNNNGTLAVVGSVLNLILNLAAIND